MTKILVIEDEAILRSEVIRWLTLEGYDAIGAPDGRAGIETAFQYLPDLIICDITMPYLNGHGVLLELRANPITIETPFIFVTARASYEDIRTGMDMGADDYITKPFTRLELFKAIHTRLEKKATLDAKRQEEVNQWQQAFDEEREQRLFKSKLVAMFSHDFRNPLTIIMSSNSLLRDYSDRIDDQRRLIHFNRIESSVSQLMQMLDDMMFISQIETGSLEFQPELINIGDFLDNIIGEFQTIAQETHTILYDNQFSSSVSVDVRLLRQIVGNLISNAIKYSPKGSAVQVGLERRADNLVLTIQDQGIGIPEVDQARLFTAFQRASNVGGIRGTGLGLAIVKQAVDLHGGALTFKSILGTGTTFSIYLPLLKTETK